MVRPRHYVDFGGGRHELNPHWRANLNSVEVMDRKRAEAHMLELAKAARAGFVPGQVNAEGVTKFHEIFPQLAVQEVKRRVAEAGHQAEIGDEEFVRMLVGIERTHSTHPRWSEMMGPVTKRFYFDGIFVDPTGKMSTRKGVKTEM